MMTLIIYKLETCAILRDIWMPSTPAFEHWHSIIWPESVHPPRQDLHAHAMHSSLVVHSRSTVSIYL